MNLIYQLDLGFKSRLDKVRDLFLIGCYTGLRFSDIHLIRKEHINDRIIKVRTTKTNETVAIPINPRVQEILEKYGDDGLPSITNQKMNQYLKEIGQLARINNSVVISTEVNGSIKRIGLPKFKLISTHTARRSFATNLYFAGVSPINIMRITGHKTEKSFLTYIRITKEQNAEKLLSHPFFQ